MSRKDEILERIKRKEALAFYTTLAYADMKDLIVYENLPKSVRIAAANFIKISSRPIAKLPCSSKIQEITTWLVDTINEPKEAKFIFKPTETYWKFWADLKTPNFKLFIDCYLNNSTGKEFYLYDYSQNKTIFLSNDEYDFQLFVSDE